MNHKRILNSYYQFKNKKGINKINKSSYEMFLDDKKIKINFKHQFISKNKYILIIVMKN